MTAAPRQCYPLAELVGPFPTPGNVATLVYMYFVSQTLKGCTGVSAWMMWAGAAI